MTAGDLLDFVINNKGTTTFVGYSDLQIARMIKDGLDDFSIWYAHENDKITGMILVEFHDGVMDITENLAMTLSNLKAFARRARKEFPHYRIEAMRHGSKRVFNTEKIYNKLN